MEDIYIYRRIPPPNASDPNDSLEDYNKYIRLNKTFLETAPLVLLAFGIPGNLVSILVLCRRAMKDNLFSSYLISMCIFNIITLTIAMSRHLSVGVFGVEMVAYHLAACRLVRWLTFTLMSVTSWHLVIITGCRVLYLINNRTRHIVESTHPFITIAICFMLCGLVELLVTAKGVYHTNEKGSNVECYLDTDSFWIYVQFFMYAVGPAIFLILFNLTIVFRHLGRGSGLQTNKMSYKVRQQLIILVFVSSMQFIITVFPVAFFYGLLKHFFDLSTKAGAARGQLAYNMTVLLFYCNNATNFLIYCFFWTKFRQELIKMFTGQRLELASSDTELKTSSVAVSLFTEEQVNERFPDGQLRAQSISSHHSEVDPAPRSSVLSEQPPTDAKTKNSALHGDKARRSTQVKRDSSTTGRKERQDSTGQAKRDVMVGRNERVDSSEAALPLQYKLSTTTVSVTSRALSYSSKTSTPSRISDKHKQ